MKNNWYDLLEQLESSNRQVNLRNLYNERTPGTMTIMCHNDTIYLASSVKKAPAESFLHLLPHQHRGQQPIIQLLEECGIEDPYDIHPNRANCGEILVLHQWTIQNPNSDYREPARTGTLIITVSGSTRTAWIKAPCPPIPCNRVECQYECIHVGCLDVVNKVGLRFLDEVQIADQYLPNLGLGYIGQCSITRYVEY